MASSGGSVSFPLEVIGITHTTHDPWATFPIIQVNAFSQHHLLNYLSQLPGLSTEHILYLGGAMLLLYYGYYLITSANTQPIRQSE